jgi:hypothetical protein
MRSVFPRPGGTFRSPAEPPLQGLNSVLRTGSNIDNLHLGFFKAPSRFNPSAVSPTQLKFPGAVLFPSCNSSALLAAASGCRKTARGDCRGPKVLKARTVTAG